MEKGKMLRDGISIERSGRQSRLKIWEKILMEAVGHGLRWGGAGTLTVKKNRHLRWSKTVQGENAIAALLETNASKPSSQKGTVWTKTGRHNGERQEGRGKLGKNVCLRRSRGRVKVTAQTLEEKQPREIRSLQFYKNWGSSEKRGGLAGLAILANEKGKGGGKSTGWNRAVQRKRQSTRLQWVKQSST